jgi:hypothetical protein
MQKNIIVAPAELGKARWDKACAENPGMRPQLQLAVHVGCVYCLSNLKKLN